MRIGTSSKIKEWEVSDKLSECFASNPRAPRTPDDEQVRALTDLINRYIETPITPEIMHEVNECMGPDIKERKILDQASSILRRERDSYADVPPDSVNTYDLWRRSRVADIDLALATLNCRGFIDFSRPPPTRRGADMKAWTAMAIMIANETIGAIKAAQITTGKPTMIRIGLGRDNGPVVRFVREMLKLILGPDESLPSLATIHEALKGRLNV